METPLGQAEDTGTGMSAPILSLPSFGGAASVTYRGAAADRDSVNDPDVHAQRPTIAQHCKAHDEEMK